MNELAPSPAKSPTSLRRVAVTTVVGTTLEWYDFFLYTTAAALIFAKQYFPNVSGAAQTIAALSTVTIGYLARPVGSILFGHFGDRVGRKKLLVISLLLMGLATFAVGLLPNFSAIGIWAPLTLFALRLLQGLAVGGEWGGALLMAVEHAPKGKRTLYGTLPQLGAPLGFLLSTVVLLIPALLLSDETFASWGWRVPFLFSFVLIGVGLYLRARVAESPEFEAATRASKVARFPLLDMFRTSWRQLVLGAGMGVPAALGYFLFSGYVLAYGTGEVGMSRNTLLISTIIGAVVMMAVMPYAAILSDRVGPRPMIFYSLVLLGLWALPAFMLFDTGNPILVTLAVSVGLLPVGSSLAAIAPWYAELFDIKLRYTGAGLTYMITGVLGSGLGAIVAPSLVGATGGGWLVALYLMAWSAIGLICLGLSVRNIKSPSTEAKLESPRTQQPSSPA